MDKSTTLTENILKLLPIKRQDVAIYKFNQDETVLLSVLPGEPIIFAKFENTVAEINGQKFNSYTYPLGHDGIKTIGELIDGFKKLTGKELQIN